jgi:hypothetical protein
VSTVTLAEFRERWPSIARIPCVDALLDQVEGQQQRVRTLNAAARQEALRRATEWMIALVTADGGEVFVSTAALRDATDCTIEVASDSKRHGYWVRVRPATAGVPAAEPWLQSGDEVR